MTATILQFEERGHRYSIEGREIPSVTQVLSSAGMVDHTFCTEFARERGGVAHKAIHYALQSDLDETTLHPMILPYVNAALQCVGDLDPSFVPYHSSLAEDIANPVVAVEQRVYSPTYGYAGTLDAVLRINGKLIIIDWKTGQPPPATGLQLAAYADAYYEETGQRISHRYACRLFPDGRYQLVPFTDRHDIEVFRAALTVAAWRKEQGLIQ